MIFKSGLLLSVVVCLTACSMSPGMHIEPDTVGDVWFKANKDEIEYQVDRITRELVKDMSDETEYPIALEDLKLQSLSYDYRLGKGDVLLITVFEHPELTMPGGPNNHPETSGTVVKNDGSIFVPYVGDVQAVGKTTSVIRKEIESGLVRYVNDPQVDVRVVKFVSKKVTIGGEVELPGTVAITNTPLTLLQAISKVQGLKGNANEKKVLLTRGERQYRIDLNWFYDGSLPVDSVILRDDDSIYVTSNESNKIYVLGEVNRAKPVAIPKAGLSLTDAIGRAGGLNQKFSNAKGVFVIREQSLEEPIRIFQLDATKPYAFVLGNKFKMQDNDVVFVTPSDSTRWNRIISQLLPTATLIQRASTVDD
ncbi:MAG: polysaccharide biosynthesis/export family protein [Gammaproteobacteria bacterium]|nr:polysaccharide biosynthesis/export family protein [Gammaproteobacteria bacterium]